MHPDNDKVLRGLQEIPAFRAQRIAAEHRGIDVVQRITSELTDVEQTLQDMGQFYFSKHRGQKRAQYGVFLTYDPATCLHGINVQIGNQAIITMSERALARIFSGEIVRERA